MSEHTKEPWNVAEEAFDNDGIHESVIRGLDGRAAIAVTLEFGPNNPGMREANARRIVACVNACAGVATEQLEQMRFSLPVEYAKAVQQRDKLLEALIEARNALENANLQNNGPICDTIWMPSKCSETLFDFMDAAIATKGQS